VPIHNLGYREWKGELESSSTRWKVVAEIGIRRAWQSAWLRRMMFFAWVPSLFMGFMIFLFEQSQDSDSASSEIFRDLSRVFLPRDAPNQSLPMEVARILGSNETPEERRHIFWSALLLNLFRRSQPFLLIPIVGVIAPPLISQDFRSRAFLLYFSRPLTKVQYILGKAATIALYLSMITLFPALILFAVGVMLSPSLSVLQVTWDLPFRILFVSAIMIIPSTSLALMLSSLTTESRYASFAWFAIWIFGFLTYVSVVPLSPPGDSSIVQCVSLFHVFSDVASWMLDRRPAGSHIETQLILLGVLTAVSIAVVYRRVSAPMLI
jgi:hypothetical protein